MAEIPTPPSGFGRQVTIQDVAEYAKFGHTCRFSRFGPGTISKFEPGKKEAIPDNCLCAIARFKKANSQHIEILTINSTSEVRWKPGSEPEKRNLQGSIDGSGSSADITSSTLRSSPAGQEAKDPLSTES